jgi:hypothetical protein
MAWMPTSCFLLLAVYSEEVSREESVGAAIVSITRATYQHVVDGGGLNVDGAYLY